MPVPTYTIEIMQTPTTWVDVTADWASAEPLVVERGIEPGGRVAGVGRLTFALHNPAGRYTPGHPDALPGFDAGARVRLRASDGVQTYPLFGGRVETIRAGQVAGSAGDVVRVTCVDDMAALHRVPVGAFPLLLDVTPGELVARLIAASIVPVGRADRWRLGHPETGRLGVLTALSDLRTGVDFDEGQSVFPWAGDTWPAARSTAAALADVCASEGGSFAILADGTPAFRDRHSRARRITPDAELAAGLAGLSVERSGERLANRVEVSTQPREVGSPGEVLWWAGHSIRIAPGEVRRLVCRYHDPDEAVRAIGALSVETPRPGADFTATDMADGSGVSLTGTVHAALDAGATAAELALWSDWTAGPVYVHNLRLRGVPLRRFTPVTVAVFDAESVVERGLHPLRVVMPLQDEPRVSEDMARALLANRAAPAPWLAVTVEATASPALLAHALSREVGDRLHVTAPELGIENVACFIDHIRHEVRRGGASHCVTWRTSPADLHAAWVLGAQPEAALGVASRLAY